MKTASALSKIPSYISSLGSLFFSSSKQFQPIWVYEMDTQDSNWLWDPYMTLDLYSLLDAHPSGCNFSCVGVTLKHARCRWPIQYAMQREACRKLDSIAVETPSSQAVSDTISELVPLLLCMQRHQRMPEQRDAKIWDWSAKIEDVAVEIERKENMTSETQQSTADPSAYQGAQCQLETSMPPPATEPDDSLESIQNHQSSVVLTLQSDLNTEDELQKTRRQLDEMKTQVSELETALEEAKAQTSIHSKADSNPKAQPQGTDNLIASCDQTLLAFKAFVISFVVIYGSLIQSQNSSSYTVG